MATSHKYNRCAGAELPASYLLRSTILARRRESCACVFMTNAYALFLSQSNLRVLVVSKPTKTLELSFGKTTRADRDVCTKCRPICEHTARFPLRHRAALCARVGRPDATRLKRAAAHRILCTCLSQMHQQTERLARSDLLRLLIDDTNLTFY